MENNDDGRLISQVGFAEETFRFQGSQNVQILNLLFIGPFQSLPFFIPETIHTVRKYIYEGPAMGQDHFSHFI